MLNPEAGRMFMLIAATDVGSYSFNINSFKKFHFWWMMFNLQKSWQCGPHARALQDQTIWNARIQRFSGGRRWSVCRRHTRSNKLTAQQNHWKTQPLHLQHLHLFPLMRQRYEQYSETRPTGRAFPASCFLSWWSLNLVLQPIPGSHRRSVWWRYSVMNAQAVIVKKKKG